jgi:hypothetical protein
MFGLPSARYALMRDSNRFVGILDMGRSDGSCRYSEVRFCWFPSVDLAEHLMCNSRLASNILTMEAMQIRNESVKFELVYHDRIEKPPESRDYMTKKN